MNQGYINNNNHINMINNNMNNKDFANPGFINNIGPNNKKNYPKYNNNINNMNPNNPYQMQKFQNNNMNNINNSNNQMFIKNKINNDINNGVINNNLKNYNSVMDKTGFNTNLKNQQNHYILSLNLKLSNNETRKINIKSLNECPSILDSLNLDDKAKKLIRDKINKTYELFRKIYEFGIKNYSYKNLADIYHQINHENKFNKKINFIKRNKSYELKNRISLKEKKLNLDEVRNIGDLNITM
jgi:hypothetical protein